VESEQPTPEEIRTQLDRVLASEPFASATRLRRFLRHVVERSLARDAEQLKEYAIGVAVFDRDEHYDPRVDSIVRVEAGRLRTKLDEYYRGAGAADPVRIRVPRGGYAPVFARGQDGVAAPVATFAAPVAAAATTAPRRRAVGWLPALALAAVVIVLTGVLAFQNRMEDRRAPSLTVAVLPFACYSTDATDQMLAARLTDGVTSELTRIGALGVLSRASALRVAGAGRPLKEIAQALNVDIVVEASVEASGDHVRIQPRLVDAVVDRKGWMESIEGRRADVPLLQRRVAEAITAAAQLRRPQGR
jgi:TolB-like protein